MNAQTVRKRFRALLLKPKPLVLIGVHDALSAKVAERIGLDALWASSFGLSASRGLPDADILSLSETVDDVRKIVEKTHTPLIVDCNSGFGDITVVDRMTRAFESMGATGICIEDNPFPKLCSFYGNNIKRVLAPPAEFARKISAVVRARKDKNFFIIARTEAFIAGHSVKDALFRANLYVDARADAIVIHSKQATPKELFDFSKRWERKIPLVSIPTKYIHSTSISELYGNKYRIIIIANQTLRASVASMSRFLTSFKKDMNNIGPLTTSIAPLEEIFSLTGVEEFEKLEQALRS